MAPTALHEHAPLSHCGYLFAKLTYELTRLAKLGSFWQIEPIELENANSDTRRRALQGRSIADLEIGPFARVHNNL